MKKRFLCFFLACLFTLVFTGCKPDNAATNAGTKTAPATGYAQITDAQNRNVVLAKRPERVVVMVPSILNYINAVGGTVVGRPTANNLDIPASMKNVPEVGHVFNINMEKVISLNPDLVFINDQLYHKFNKILETNHISTIVLQPKTYDEIKAALNTVGLVYGKKEAADKKNREMDDKIASILDRLPKDRQKRIVILHATPSTVTVELENSIAGSVAKMLGFANVAAGSAAIQGKPEKTPYSMEALVEKNPDIIFITSMGAQDKIEKRLQADVKGNPAYAALTAVKNNQVYVLPEDLFLLAPGLRYPEAVELMAKKVFPENFK